MNRPASGRCEPMFIYQETRSYFAQIADGLAELALAELTALGARQIESAFRGFRFCADPQVLYLINYQSRLASRILAPLAAFPCRDRNDLYMAAKAVPWERLFGVGQTFAVLASGPGNEQLRHSKFAALCVKDAVADQFRERTGRRPNVDKTRPDIWIHLHIEKERATISLDTSGGALHRRGSAAGGATAPSMTPCADQAPCCAKP